jgi:hypothetical protein
MKAALELRGTEMNSIYLGGGLWLQRDDLYRDLDCATTKAVRLPQP